MAELAAVRQGLMIAWHKGVKFLQLELDSKVVLHWLTNKNMNYPTNMLPLICDCKNLLDQEWEVHVHHVYHEANSCANALAERGTRQQTRTTVYNDCPIFVHWFALNKTPAFHKKKNNNKTTIKYSFD